MAHIDYRFQMQGDPAKAQEMFMRDIAPDLRKDGSFHIVRDHPGHLVFNDSLDPEGVPEGEADVMGSESVAHDEEGLTDRRPPVEPLIGGSAGVGSSRPRPKPVEDVLSRHLRIEFSAAGGGTDVRIHGHARPALRDALERLGTPEHWPAIADRPHD